MDWGKGWALDFALNDNNYLRLGHWGSFSPEKN